MWCKLPIVRMCVRACGVLLDSRWLLIDAWVASFSVLQVHKPKIAWTMPRFISNQCFPVHVQPLEAAEPVAANGLANGENGDAPMEHADAEPDAETRRAREVLGMVRPGLHMGASFDLLHACMRQY